MPTQNAATNSLENSILSFLFKNNAANFSSPGNNLYVGLATAVSDAEAGSVTEANFGAYARQQVTAANWTLTSASDDDQTVSNSNNIEFPASTGTDNTITHIFIASAATSGVIYFVGAAEVSKQIQTGDIYRINAGNFTIKLN